MYFNNKFYISELKLKMLNSYLSLLLKFNINVVIKKSNYRLRKLYFYTDEDNYTFNLKSYVSLFKNVLHIFSKFESSNFFFNIDRKFATASSNNDFLSGSFVLPEFNYLKVINETKFIKFILSKNIDFSLFNILHYKKSLNRKDFAIAFKYIIYNNLIKFFKSTKLEKNFISIK